MHREEPAVAQDALGTPQWLRLLVDREFRQKQAADPGLASIPVIVVTAARPSQGELARLAAEDCFLKPVDTERLLSAVRRLC